MESTPFQPMRVRITGNIMSPTCGGELPTVRLGSHRCPETCILNQNERAPPRRRKVSSDHGLASRILSKSKQLSGGQILLQREHVVPVRFFAKEAAPSSLKEMMLKNIFLDVKKKFETAMGILRKEKITIEPENPAAVEQYAKVMKTVRENLDYDAFCCYAIVNLPGQTCSQNLNEFNTPFKHEHKVFQMLEHLLTLKEIRVRRGLTDELGAEAMMMDALEKVEKETGKPLMRNDKKGMALLMAEFDKINKKLGIRKEDLPKYEEQLELKIAKAQLEELKKEALEAMETQKKREEFKDEEMVDVKSLDIRNFI